MSRVRGKYKAWVLAKEVKRGASQKNRKEWGLNFNTRDEEIEKIIVVGRGGGYGEGGSVCPDTELGGKLRKENMLDRLTKNDLLGRQDLVMVKVHRGDKIGGGGVFVEDVGKSVRSRRKDYKASLWIITLKKETWAPSHGGEIISVKWWQAAEN